MKRFAGKDLKEQIIGFCFMFLKHFVLPLGLACFYMQDIYLYTEVIGILLPTQIAWVLVPLGGYLY